VRYRSRKLSTYVELRPDDKDARSMADRCGEIAALVEVSSAYQRLLVRDPSAKMPFSVHPHMLRQATDILEMPYFVGFYWRSLGDWAGLRLGLLA
jgi:hypothetical protein